MNAMSIGFYVVAGLLAVWLLCWMIRFAFSLRRRSKLKRWAKSRGLAYRWFCDDDMRERYPEFKVLQPHSYQYARAEMHGWIDGYFVKCFDYYHSRWTSNRHEGIYLEQYFPLGVVIVELAFPFEPMRIRPKALSDRVGWTDGWEGVEFELNEFNRMFEVRSSHRRFAFDVIHPEAMELLQASPPFILDFQKRRLMLYRCKKFRLEDFEAAVTLAMKLLDQVPEYLREEQEDAAHADD